MPARRLWDKPATGSQVFKNLAAMGTFTMMELILIAFGAVVLIDSWLRRVKSPRMSCEWLPSGKRVAYQGA
ncbi:MAG: hypothetical protein NTAFB01_39190 [Nitrospira sp.]